MSHIKKGNITIIMGDFNMQVDWENQVGRRSLEKGFVKCLMVEPMREQAVLNLVMCNEAD